MGGDSTLVGPLCLTEHMKLRGHGVERGEFGGRRLELQKGFHGTRLGVHEDAGDQVREDPYAVHGADAQTRALDERGELIGGETVRYGIALAPASVRVVERLLGLLEVAA